MNNEDIAKFQPKNMEQMKDLQDRMAKASELFGTKMKDILNEVDKEYQITFQLGLDKNNQFAYIVPIYIPKNTKEYEQPSPYIPDAEAGVPKGEPSPEGGA